MSGEIDNILWMEDAGAAAVVLPSLFEEQLSLESYELHHHLTYGTESFPESLTYFPEHQDFRLGSEEYLNLIQKTKEKVKIPIMPVVNATGSSEVSIDVTIKNGNPTQR